MSEWNSVDFASQGWQCPICKRVYSPTTPMCYYCGNGVPCTVSSTTVGDSVIEMIRAMHDANEKQKRIMEAGE